MATTYSHSKNASSNSEKFIRRPTAQKKPVAQQAHPMEIIQRVRANPSSMTHDDVMQLQGTIGNRAVAQLLSEVHGKQKTQTDGKPVQMKTDKPIQLAKGKKPKGPKKKNGLRDIVHTGLDIVGLVPGYGEIADGANALLYLAEGGAGNAALSAASMIPLAGYGATSAKWIKKGAKYTEGASKLVKHSDDIGEAYGQIHHILSKKIMKALENHPTQKGKFERENPMFKYRAADADAHKGYQDWHRNVDNKVVDWLQNNPKATEQQFKNFLNNLYQSPDIRKRIPNVNIK